MGSDPFTVIDLVLSANSYLIACTNSQIFIEQGENCASAISLTQLEPMFLITRYDINLFFLNLNIRGRSIMIGIYLTSIGEKNQVLQVSFENYVARDFISVSSHECSDVLDSDSLDIFQGISYYGAQ